MKHALIIATIVIAWVIGGAFLFAKLVNAQDFGAEATTLEGEVDANTQGLIDLLTRMDELEAKVDELGSGEPEPDPDPDVPPPVTGVETGQDPFVQTRIPGYIQAENYDLGGSGVSYADSTPGNVGGAYRADDVDIKEIAVGEYVTGWNANGEWSEHTVGAKAGTYDVWIRFSNGTSRDSSIKLILDTTEVATVVLPSTGGWSNFTTVVARNVPVVRTGNMVFRIEIVLGPVDLDWLRFVTAGTAINRAPTDILLCDQAEDGTLVDCV
jgi:hypothetical protein